MSRQTALLLLLLIAAPAAFPQTAACRGGSIQLLTPADGATATSPVSFSWTAVTGATSYRVWVIVDGAPATVAANTTTNSTTGAAPSGTIEWYVEALSGACPSVVSPHSRFTIPKGAACDLRKAPSLVSPVTGIVPSPVTFNWSTVAGALLYRVWISVDGGAFDDLAVSTKSQLTADVPPGNIQWFVEAFTEGCPAIRSTTASFTVSEGAKCANATPMTISPADSSNTKAPVTFTWSAAANADEYRVVISMDGGDPFVLGKTTDTTLTKVLPPGSFVWFVVAVFDDCGNTRSPISRFTIPKAQTCPTQPPTLAGPADGATNVISPVTLDWNGLAGAVGYAVFFRHNNDEPTRLSESATLAAPTQVTLKLPDGSFEWWVVAFFPLCPPLESVHRTFTIVAVCDNRRPVLFVPHDGSTDPVPPVHFAWSKTPNAKSYDVWVATAGNAPTKIGSTTDNKLTANVPPGGAGWFVDAIFDAPCPTTTSAVATFFVSAAPPCGTPKRPLIRVPARVASNTQYVVRWTAVANAASYEVQESPTNDFRNATTQVSSEIVLSFTHTASQPTRYFYRIRAVSGCSDDRGAYSKIVSALVIPQSGSRSATLDLDSSSGTTQTITLPPQNPATTFTARTDKPWLTVTPTSGPIGASGATLTVTSNRNALLLGSNTASVMVTYASSSSGRIAANATPPSSSIPISVSIATPVASTGKNAPPPNSLIVPAIAHATGLGGTQYQSDVRLANVGADVTRYLLNFTLSRTDGTQTGQSTTIDVDPGATLALDDLLNSFFGLGTDSGSATGVLEIRPLSSTPSVSVVSSRTYNITSTGTFGEFIPAIPFSQFIGQTSPKSVLSLQHIAQSTAYRTNLGLVEANGENANVLIHVFDNSGNEVSQIPLALLPGEHRQITSFLQQNAINLNEGRIEVEVTSATGKVSAYASVVDNLTNDPYLVSPVLKGSSPSTRFVLPDVEVNTATSKRSDVRLFNSGSSTVTATLAYSGSGQSVQVSIPPGQVKALDNVLLSSFNLSSSTGALLVATSSASSLVVTGRTYTVSQSGTIGQFMPAVTPSQAVGRNERALQLLQLEDSDQYKTTIGLAEASGAAAMVEISVIQPDAKAYPKVQIPLDPGGFQVVSLASFGLGNVYNARVTVKVVSGTGRVTAYGSLTDQATFDPTFVPAQ